MTHHQHHFLSTFSRSQKKRLQQANSNLIFALIIVETDKNGIYRFESCFGNKGILKKYHGHLSYMSSFLLPLCPFDFLETGFCFSVKQPFPGETSRYYKKDYVICKF